MGAKKLVWSRLFSGAGMSLVFIVVYCAFSVLFVDKFANPVNLRNILVQSADLIILSCGMTFVFMNGGIDFSVTAVLGLGSVLGAQVMKIPGDPLVMSCVGVAFMLLLGLAIGSLNGLTVTLLISLLGPLTMACFNPARDLGPRVFSSLAGWRALPFQVNGHGWLTVYIVAPLVGGLLGGFLYRVVFEANYRTAERFRL